MRKRGLRARARLAGASVVQLGLDGPRGGSADRARRLMRPRGVLFAPSNRGAAQRAAVERRSANASEARRAAQVNSGGAGLTDKGEAGVRRPLTTAAAEAKFTAASQAGCPSAVRKQSGSPSHSYEVLQRGNLDASALAYGH